jgi:hypothetical protein
VPDANVLKEELCMTSILRTLMPLKPTKQGLRFVASPEFQLLCERLVASAVVRGDGPEAIETRLRHATVGELLPHRRYSADAVADFYAANWKLVDSAWKKAVAPMLTTANFGAAIARVLGVSLPSPVGVVDADALDHPIKGRELPADWREGVHFERV